MDEKALNARRAYQKEWRRKNKDKIKANTERYWQKQAQRLTEFGINAVSSVSALSEGK